MHVNQYLVVRPQSEVKSPDQGAPRQLRLEVVSQKFPERPYDERNLPIWYRVNIQRDAACIVEFGVRERSDVLGLLIAGPLRPLLSATRTCTLIAPISRRVSTACSR